MLVGQVRFPWISAVYASTKHSWRDDERLRLVVPAGGETRMTLTLGFPKSADAAGVATEVVHRAATFRLANDPELTDAERERLTALIRLPPIINPRGSQNMSGERFPTHWQPGEQSARLGVGAEGLRG